MSDRKIAKAGNDYFPVHPEPVHPNSRAASLEGKRVFRRVSTGDFPLNDVPSLLSSRLSAFSKVCGNDQQYRVRGGRIRARVPAAGNAAADSPVIRRWMECLSGRRSDRIPLGSVRFGDLGRLSPIGVDFGFDRGTPVDRYYIESFLSRNAADIRGRVVELSSNDYTLRFGGARVTQSDILSLTANNRRATITGDLVQPSTLPAAAFDCIIFTQTLQYIYDSRAAVATLYQALKPGGVLLATAPGLTPMGDHPGRPETTETSAWYWSVTPAGLHALLADCFGPHAVAVEPHGNIFAVTAFLHGLALEEVDAARLKVRDSRYPVIAAARAVKGTDQG
jgi:SAM-dependent methyltransferase